MRRRMRSCSKAAPRFTIAIPGLVAQKPAEDLHAHEYGAGIFSVAKMQGGYARQFKPWKGLTAGVGGSVSLSLVPPELAPRYGGRVAPGFAVFASVRPPRHGM